VGTINKSHKSAGEPTKSHGLWSLKERAFPKELWTLSKGLPVQMGPSEGKIFKEEIYLLCGPSEGIPSFKWALP
jgi:hypothetical protein